MVKLDLTAYTRLKAGRVGVMSDSGTGTRYWGPITTATNTPAGGAYMAYEHFIEDTLVDVTPYTPRNWSPDYGSLRFSTGYDTTGFVFRKLDTSLIYKHKPGAQYPVTCKIAPYTNLQWRDYEFSGKIVKPAGAVYDSIWVGVDVYSSSENQYRIKFKNDTMMVSGGRFGDTIMTLGSDFDNGDELYFKITTLTDNREIGDTIYPDSKINLYVDIGINNPSPSNVFYQVDTTANLIKEGYPTVYIDLDGKENSATGAFKIENIEIKKHD